MNKGFTLTELSIVIVVISLLVAGIVGGASVINSSKLRVVIKEVKEYESAISVFEEKFKYLPGDFPQAKSYWSDTENGDGNWQVSTAESEYVPQQLTLSSALSGSYSVGTTSTFEPGIDIPRSNMDGGVYWFHYHSAAVHDVSEQHAIDLAAMSTDPDAVILTPKDAYGIDQKQDDGIPDSGYVYGNGDDAASCADTTNHIYFLDSAAVECRLNFWYFRR